jgi:hypothetical protein
MMYEFRIRAKDMASLHQMILEAADNIKGGSMGKVYNQTPAVGHTVFPTTLPAFPEADAAPSTPSVEQDPDVDTAGVPYNPAIHSATRAKKADGTWKARRGANKDEAPVVAASPAAAPTLAPPPVPTSHVPMPAFPEMPATPPLAALPPLPQPQALPTNGVYTFESFKANLVLLIADLVNKGKITQQYVGQLNQHFGTREIAEVVHKDAQARELYELFAQLEFIVKLG